MLPLGRLPWRGDDCLPLCIVWICKEDLENDAMVLITAHPGQLTNGGLSDLCAVPRDTFKDGHQELLEDLQLGESNFLVCL